MSFSSVYLVYHVIDEDPFLAAPDLVLNLFLPLTNQRCRTDILNHLSLNWNLKKTGKIRIQLNLK